MPSQTLDFSGQIDSWVAQTKERTVAVFRESAKRTISLSQSYVPVDTGFLRASIRASTEAMPPIIPGSHGDKHASFGYDPSQVVVAIAGAQIGQTIYAGYTAAYAKMVNDGTSKMAPRAFVDRAAMQWKVIVNGVTQELKGRVLSQQ